MSSAESHKGPGVPPLLAAVAEFVIEFSIAVKKVGVYGTAHPVVAHNLVGVQAKLTEALRYQPQVTLHFAGETILCEDHYLDRKSPIYRQLGQLVSGAGIAVMSFSTGVGPRELAGLIAVLNAARRERLAPSEMRQRIDEAALEPQLKVEFLRDLLAFTEVDEARASDESEAERLWQPFLASLREADPEARAEGEQGLAEAGAPPEAGGAEDYAQALIDYLKLLDRSQRERLRLRGNLVGVKLDHLLAALRPELREQIVSSVLTSPALPPSLTNNFLEFVGHEHLLDALERLNQEGRSLPTGVAAALSLLSLETKVRPILPAAPGGADGGTSSESAPAPHSALEPLRSDEDEDVAAYASAEYSLKLAALEGYARRVAGRPGDRDVHGPPLGPLQAEQHFIDLGRAMLGLCPEDKELAAGIAWHAGAAFADLRDQRQGHRAVRAMALGREARSSAGDLAEIPPWEEEATLGELVSRLGSRNADVADDAAVILAGVGRRAVGPLLALFASADLAARHRAFDVLVQMADDPGEELRQHLGPEQPWYEQRNILAVLRSRRDFSAVEAARGLWACADVRVKLEILRYLHGAADPQGLVLLREALHAKPQKLQAAAARLVPRWQTPEAVQVLRQRLETLPALQAGTAHHLELLRSLARSGDDEARRYVASVPQSIRALPWRAAKLRTEVERMLAGAGGKP